ncbi:hypothetical protein LOD99_4300 [Oopsacas minuta]|uniref:Uncharacterized protein n=1 Tax=Oopsacas minuta TaxID=111878 RepID=A0AAV7JWN2_9METZ|nr:hypothetical protein LOD99_4300 [Oopsacas minuta]
MSSAVSSLPPSASEVEGFPSKPPTSDKMQEPNRKLKQRKLTPMPPAVGTGGIEQKWAEKFRSQTSNTKQPRIEEWVSSTVDQKNLKKAPSLDDDSEADILVPVDSETQKKFASEVLSKSEKTKLSDLQAHLQWVSQSSVTSKPGESNIAEKEKERIFDEVLRSEERQKQLESAGIGEKENESGNQLREKEEEKRQKYREMRIKEEHDRTKNQERLVAQKKEEERKFFEQQKYKYIIEEPSHFGTHTSSGKKKPGIIRRLSGLLKKSSSSPYERRGQPDGADSESGSLEPFNKLTMPHSDSSNYEVSSSVKFLFSTQFLKYLDEFDPTVFQITIWNPA